MTTHQPSLPALVIRRRDSAALGDLGKPAEARSLYKRALSIAEATYGINHPHTATIQRNLEALDE
jgi:hypothetical protein